MALFIKIAKKPSVLFSPHSIGDHNYGWRTQNLGSPAANDAGVIAFASHGSPSAAQIKSAYRKLARIHHPDNFMTQSAQLIEAAEVKMKNINAAYEYLKNNP